jgi:SNF2 family DNA or RNA helicase
MVTRLIFCEETAKYLLQKSSMDIVTIQECSAMSSQSPNAGDNQNHLEDRNKTENYNPSGGLASIEDQHSIFESKRPQLLPHQLEGVHFLLSNLCNNTGCILADHMGLGKTAQVIVALERYFISHCCPEVRTIKHKIRSCDSQIGRDMETVPVYARHLSEGCSFAFYL